MNSDIVRYGSASGEASVRAITMWKSERVALPTIHLVPSITHSSPSRVAEVVNWRGSEPVPCSVIENAL